MTSPSTVLAALPQPHRRNALARVLTGDHAQERWIRPSFLTLLAIAAVLYIWNLSDSAYANSFYAAAVEAGSKSWKALLFGSLDSSNFITVDKPPASLWVMGISARIFGFSSWSILVPQALMGVGAVALLYGAVRRSLLSFGRRLSAIGGLVAGFALAFTPAAALMFRFDNPDALLTLLMTAAAYSVIRALPKASVRWLVLAGVALGFAFLTKMLQGLLVLPAFGFVYLLAAPVTFRRRILHLLAAAGALVVAAGWWLVVVALVPASARPYIGGSTNNTVLDLVFGYNGFGRLFGGTGNGGGGSGTSGSSFGGATGLQRLFSSEMGLEISWLLPAALLALIIGLVVAWRRGRSDPLLSAFVLWGGWLVVTGLVFSYMSGTIHPYYTVALAPAIAGLVALGGVTLWSVRSRWIGRLGLAAMVFASGVWAFVLLGENADWLPWLRWVLLAGALVSSGVIVFASTAEAVSVRARPLTVVAVLAGLLFSLGGPVAYSVATASVAHSGSIPSVGSTSSGGMGAGGMGAGGMGAGGMSGSGMGAGGTGGGGMGGTGAGGTPPAGMTSRGQKGGGTPPTGTQTGSTSTSTSTSNATSAAALDTALAATSTRWAAAVDGSQSAATLELSSGTAVMAIGGWSDDPTPTLAQFKAYVAAGDIGYYIVSEQGGGGGGGNSSSSASAIKTWVTANYTAKTVGGSTIYQLTK